MGFAKGSTPSCELLNESDTGSLEQPAERAERFAVRCLRMPVADAPIALNEKAD